MRTKLGEQEWGDAYLERTEEPDRHESVVSEILQRILQRSIGGLNGTSVPCPDFLLKAGRVPAVGKHGQADQFHGLLQAGVGTGGRKHFRKKVEIIPVVRQPGITNIGGKV
jgi:hypothetical protein